ncbi:hypothetical protein Tco_0415307, partial [Tanacetum coccineum]
MSEVLMNGLALECTIKAILGSDVGQRLFSETEQAIMEMMYVTCTLRHVSERSSKDDRDGRTSITDYLNETSFGTVLQLNLQLMCSFNIVPNLDVRTLQQTSTFEHCSKTMFAVMNMSLPSWGKDGLQRVFNYDAKVDIRRCRRRNFVLKDEVSFEAKPEKMKKEYEKTTTAYYNKQLCLNSLLEDQAELYRALSESVTLMDEIGHEAVSIIGLFWPLPLARLFQPVSSMPLFTDVW